MGWGESRGRADQFMWRVFDSVVSLAVGLLQLVQEQVLV